MQTQETLSPEHMLGEQPVASGMSAGVAIPVVLLAILLAVVARAVLFAPSYFEDDRYNMGVVKRSALPDAQYTLETSITHWYFEPYSIPRAEDWHRGLSLVLLTQWAKLVGTDSETLLRLPHLVWVFAWFYLALRIFWTLDSAAARSLRCRLWTAVLIVGALALMPIAQTVFIQAYLDDVPALVFLLLGVLVLLRREQITLLTVGLFGLCLGLSYAAKEMYVLWIVIGGLTVIALTWVDGETRTLRHVLSRGAVFAAAALVVIVPRMLWTLHERGTLSSPVLYWVVARFYGEPRINPHYPFFLFDDDRYLSRIDMAGGFVPMLEKTFLAPEGPFAFALNSLANMSFAWVWLVPTALAQRLGIDWSKRQTRLSVLLLIGIVVYGVLFMGGLGESNPRYWLGHITLVIVLGIQQTLALKRRLNGTPSTRWTRAAQFAALAFVFVFLHVRPAELMESVAPELPPNSLNVLEAIAERLEPDQAVMMDVKSGMYYFSLHPQDHVVGFTRFEVLKIETPEQAQRLFETYNIRLALYTYAPTIERLKQFGFEEIGRLGNQVVLERNTS